MKNSLMGILFMFLATLSMAKDIDVTKSKGTEQGVIVSLTPLSTNMDVDQDVVITAVFDVKLDAKHVQKNNVKLKHITQTKESIISGEVAYDATQNAVTFTPNSLLTHGYYEVEFKSLKATKANKSEKIKEIKYRFYVAEVINGYKLPPEPDETVNNSTLLGIDVNDNGVRDDVERYIIKTNKDEKIAIEIGFQLAKAYNIVIKDPANAEETTKVMENAQDCESYFMNYADLFGDPIVVNKEISSPQFKSLNLNTEERIRAYLQYNRALSGGVFSLPHASQRKEKCTFDVEQMLKDR